MVRNVYNWENIHQFFPSEKVEQLRKQIIDEWKSGKFKDREIWERYGMSENAFYDLIKRYSEEKENGLIDKSKKPKNPHHKLETDDIKIIIQKAKNEQERIKSHQSEFENDMMNSGRSLSKSKIEGLKDSMNSAIHGVRRIAHEFNMDMQWLGRTIHIGKSRVHDILTSAGIYEKNGNIVVENLEFLRRVIPSEQKIGIRSDGGKEFNNKTVKNFCNDNNIILHIIPKASPWIQAFIERGFRTLKQEFLNLVWIGNWDKFKDVLIDSRFGYNNRPHSSFPMKNISSPFQPEK